MDTRNMIMAVVLSVAIMVGFQFYFGATNAPPESTKTSKIAPSTPVAPSHPSTPGTTAGGPTVLPGSPAAVNAPALPGQSTPADAAMQRSKALGAAKRVRIQSPRLTGSISLTGARFDDLTLNGYRETIKPGSPNIKLLHPIGTTNPYYANFGWVAAANSSVQAPPVNANWSANRDVLSPEIPVTLRWTSPEGVIFKMTIKLDKNYMFSVTQRVENNSSKPLTFYPYGQIARTGTPETTGFYILHEGLLGVFDGVLEETTYDEVQDARVIKRKSTGGWIGITDKYWLTALIPDQKTATNSEFRDDRQKEIDNYRVNFLEGASTVVAGGVAETTNRLFAGAKEAQLITAYRDELNISRFDLAIDWGWFEFLTKPIFMALMYFNGFLGNMGFSILLLTVLIKLAFFPLANKSYRAMSKMKQLQPEMMKLRERFAEDKARLNQEIMGMYKREKANPAAGCLPILPQIPVFFALYKVVFVTIELRHAPFVGWIHDLSAPDPVTLLTGFGLFTWNVPEILHIANIGVWPIIMGITMFAQQKLNPPPPDPMQAKIFMFLPLIFTFMLAGFPAGLVIYWAWNNFLSVAQQYVIMRRAGVPIGGGKAKPKAPKKS